MSSRATPKVVVLMGGISFEREVSLSSGRECAAALRSEGYDVTELDAGPDVALRLSELCPDVVFKKKRKKTKKNKKQASSLACVLNGTYVKMHMCLT